MNASQRTHCVLVVSEDAALIHLIRDRLSGASHKVLYAGSVDEAMAASARYKPAYGVVDLVPREKSRLPMISSLKSIVPHMRVVVATHYGSIASAVDAMKRGAVDYFTTPFKADELVAALLGGHEPARVDASVEQPGEGHLALRRAEWEYIQRVLLQCDGNISETARRLHLHRRTLQRKLSKHPVPEATHLVH